jgi:NADH-quinone oxidoreductase subunit H
MSDGLLRAIGTIVAALLAVPFVAWLEGLRGRATAGTVTPPGVIVGPRGAATAWATAVKLLEKRAPRAADTDRLLHATAPILAVIPTLSVPAIIPLQRADPVAASLPFVMGLSLLSTGAVALAGWGSGNRLAHLASLRLVALRLSVLVVVAASSLAAARAGATLDLGTLIEAQARPLVGGVPRWNILLAPTAFFAALVALAIHAQVILRGRTEPTLAEPWFGGATGPVLLGHRIFESLDLLAGGCVLAVVFLGGWHVPLLDVAGAPIIGPAVTIAKVALALIAIVAVRNALPTSLTPALAVRICFIGLLPLAVVALVFLEIVSP